MQFEWDAEKDRANQAKHGVDLVVVHVYREAKDGEEIIRIISARKAGKGEGRRYFQ
jgi:uncharacterized DUF497 family protein